uniref:Uncharacterized protein n=1 Tax=Anguilla anguilla TaxID=7936 RepID=A0A0E9XI36_ANGAN
MLVICSLYDPSHKLHFVDAPLIVKLVGNMANCMFNVDPIAQGVWPLQEVTLQGEECAPDSCKNVYIVFLQLCTKCFLL